MARELVYTDSKKPVQVGDKHRMCGWLVKVVGMQDVEKEIFGQGSVRIVHCQGAHYEHSTFASNIAAEWVAA